jgi:hypothetical protein
MKTFLNPSQFTFTNRFGGPHFNQSLLKSRIAMMNRQSSWQSGWRYATVAVVLLITAVGLRMLTKPQEVTPKVWSQDNPFGTRYLVEKNGKLYGVITPYATDKDIEAIRKTLMERKVPFQLVGVQRDDEGRIVEIKDVVMGDYGSEAIKVIRRRKKMGRFQKAFFDFCYDPEFGCYPNIHPKEFPNSLSQTLLLEGVVSNGSIGKQFIYDPLLKDKMNGVKRGRNLARAEMEETWTGNMNQLLEASFFKRKGVMLYVRPDKHLDLYDEYKKSVTIFVDRKQATLKELREVHIRQVAIVYAHKRRTKESMLGISNRNGDDTDYVVWIDRAPNRMKRDSSIHIVSPFYTGDF